MDDLFSKTLPDCTPGVAAPGMIVYGVADGIDHKVPVAAPNGLAPLGEDNLVPAEHLPTPAPIPPPAFVPTYIAAGETFFVPANKQALYALPIVVDGALVIDGTLVEVA